MKKIILVIIMVPCMSYAMNFAEVKHKVKEIITPYLSQNLVSKIFGVEKVEKKISYEMPEIPKLKASATDLSIYKSKAINRRKTSFDSLSDLEKEKYRISFLKELFFETSRQRISEVELSTYVDRFNQGVSREGIYRSIVSSKKYYELEANPSLPSDELVAFTIDFGERFLNTFFKVNSLKNANRYVIKRNLTDKSLDLISYFSNTPESLYRWYAIISSEFAKYEGWRNKFRSIKSQKFHYDWAKKSPLSHIQSEVIIKIHKLCNNL